MKYNIKTIAESIFLNISSESNRYTFDQDIEPISRRDKIVLGIFNNLILSIFNDKKIELSLNRYNSINIYSTSKTCSREFKSKGNEYRTNFRAASIIIPRVKIDQMEEIKNGFIPIVSSSLTDESKDYINKRYILPSAEKISNALRGICMLDVHEYCGNHVLPSILQLIYSPSDLYKSGSNYCYCYHLHGNDIDEKYYIFLTVDNHIKSWEVI